MISFVLLMLMLSAIPSSAQRGGTASQPLIVGVTELPPFTMKADDGRWRGLSIQLWRRVAVDLDMAFEIRAYDRLKGITEALVKREIDLTCAVAVTEDNETVLDLSHAYDRSGTGMAVSSRTRDFSWIHYLNQVSSMDVLSFIGLLLLLSAFCGTLIWLIERKTNPAMFGGAFDKGMGQGLWWALVTMTTVGYGDKAPRTVCGRTIAVVWMFMSVFFIAGYTAVITSSMTVNELSGRVRGLEDLPHVRVGALSRSENMAFLESRGIPVLGFDDMKSGLQAIVDDRIDAFVDNTSQLSYLAKKYFPGSLHVLPETLELYYVSMGMPPGSPLREPLNRVIAKLIAQDDWEQIKATYIGSID